MKKSIIPYIALSMFGEALVNNSYAQPKRGSKARPCLNCGKLKIHNNSFCSGDCCREYKQKKKAEKKR